MKKWIIVLMVGALSACGGEQPAVTTESVPEAAAPVMADIPEPADMPVPFMVEYVWHQAGDNFSDAALNNLTDQWAGYAAEAGWGLMMAAVNTPRFEDERFDFLWVMMWPSQEARDGAWSSWAENYEPKWLEDSAGIFTYSGENAFGFAPTPVRQPGAPNASGMGISEYMFCSYNEGYDAEDLADFVEAHNAFMDGYEAANGVSGYWAATMAPLFDQSGEDSYDYMWFNGWSSDEERDAGWEAYNAAAHAATAEEFSTCDGPYVFDSRVIYTAEA